MNASLPQWKLAASNVRITEQQQNLYETTKKAYKCLLGYLSQKLYDLEISWHIKFSHFLYKHMYVFMGMCMCVNLSLKLNTTVSPGDN